MPKSEIRSSSSSLSLSSGTTTGMMWHHRGDNVLAWTKRIADTGIGRIFLPRSVGGDENVPKFMAAFETLTFHDISLVIKLGVQFGLFAGSIQQLGSEYHHQKYLPDAAAAKLMGCFAMTEIGHGSNVKDLETTAVYDGGSDCFILHSPTYSAGKNFIGNAAEMGGSRPCSRNWR